MRIAAVLYPALILLPLDVFAQTPQPLVRLDNSGCPAAAETPPAASIPDSLSTAIGSRINESPDIVLLASVHADRIRFAAQPQIRLRLCWRGDSLRIIERTNLPSPVVAGTTYRDVYINLEILGYVNAACIASRITASRSDSTSGSCAGLTAGVRR